MRAEASNLKGISHMNHLLFLTGVILIFCAIFQKLFRRTGVPGLFLFIAAGMIFGSDGLFRIPFENYDIAGTLCSAALVLIIYYGGLGTNLKAARPVLGKAILLSGLGSLITAVLVSIFAILVLQMKTLEGLLLGAVICSTDAASVFSILRSRKMDLRYGTASLLEVESGSNDPVSYLLTMVVLSLMQGEQLSAGHIVKLLCLQILVGALVGFLLSFAALRLLRLFHLKDAVLTEALLLGFGLLSYALAAGLDGNGYLAVYIAGIVIGNHTIPDKTESIRFFHSLTSLMQMLLFFLLGLLAFPSRLPSVAFSALLTALFLTFAARPAAVFLLLAPMHCPRNQRLFISFAGMRGAASIAFAILAVSSGISLSYDLFHMVFFIVLFSILVQGSLIPSAARKLDLIDDQEDVMATFNDTAEDLPVQFVRFQLPQGHPWDGRMVSEITFPPQSILPIIERGSQQIVPKGDTCLQAGDILILCGAEGGDADSSGMHEICLTAFHDWTGKKLSDLALEDELIIFIRRKGNTLIPYGDTVLLAGDLLYVISKPSSEE